MIMEKYVSCGASVSGDGIYRYSLWREWRGTHDRANWRWFGCKDGAGAEMGEPKAAVFVMLNPSTADGARDDATIRKCVAFCRRWRYERLEVVNLFAFRSRHPKDLLAMLARGDPIGPRNQESVERACRKAGVIVCGWGANVERMQSWFVENVRGWIGDRPTFALGFTKDGHPKHPLYVPLDVTLSPMPD